MKKSKLLMPLTGIAAIGAIAPVAVMTACHKNQYKLIDSYSWGVDGEEFIYDVDSSKNALLVGADTLAASKAAKLIVLPFTTKLALKPTTGHKFYYSWKAQGTAANALYVEDQAEAEITAPSVIVEDERTFISLLEVKVHDSVTLTADETFNFKVTYTEKDAEDKVVGTQDVTYTIIAFAKKNQCPKIEIGTLAGTETGKGKQFDLTGFTLWNNVKAEAQINVTVKNTELTLTSAKGSTLKVANSGAIAAGKDALNLGATLTQGTGEGSTISFTCEEDLILELSESTGKYVATTWNAYVATTDKKVTITPAA